MEKTELLELFKEYWSNEDFVDHHCDMPWCDKSYQTIKEWVPNNEDVHQFSDQLGPFKVVSNVTTTDGDAHFVVHLKEHDTYIKVIGYWNSYENYADYTGEYSSVSFKLVEPIQKTVTFYE